MGSYDFLRGLKGPPGYNGFGGAAHVHFEYDENGDAKALEDAPDVLGTYEQVPEDLRAKSYKARGSDAKQGDIIVDGVRQVFEQGKGYVPHPELPASPLAEFGTDGSLVSAGYNPANGLWYGPGDPAAQARTDAINDLLTAAIRFQSTFTQGR